MKGLQMLELKQNHDNVNEARNTSIFNNSILNSKINATGTHDWLIGRFLNSIIELLNIDAFLASFTLSYSQP